jgi:GNAT superfamily N-acetyltransferase
MPIRTATVADAAAIAAVHVASWQAAYRGQVPDDRLDGLDPAKLAIVWETHLAEQDSATLVAEVDERVVGFCRVTWSDAVPGTGEIAALYLHPDVWGTGVGRRLCRDALSLLAACDRTDVVLWALSGNARAERFYAAAGFRPDGATRMHPRLDLPMLRYRRALTQGDR